MTEPILTPRKSVTACYDHLGGRLGEGLFRFLVEKGWITKSPAGRDYEVTAKGWTELASLGVDVARLRTAKRKMVVAC